MCMLYQAFIHPSTGARGSPPMIAPHLRSEEAKMAELHYMEMGWSGSGWMDPLPTDPPAPTAPPAAPAPAARSTARAGTAAMPPAAAAKPTRKAAPSASKKAPKKAAKQSAKK